jgi:hypothetical protein
MSSVLHCSMSSFLHSASREALNWARKSMVAGKAVVGREFLGIGSGCVEDCCDIILCYNVKFSLNCIHSVKI